jgi:DNA-binding Xre family transcriptional regulator
LSSLNLSLTDTNYYDNIYSMKKKKELTIRFGLGKIIASQGISYREVARRTGLSTTAISVLAGEPSQVQLVTVTKLCSGLDVTPADLFIVEETK